jgi:hypothetical protein
MLRWQAALIIEDAYKKQIQDTLIDSLQSRADFLELELREVSTLYGAELSIEQERTKLNRELITYESSLKEIAYYDRDRFKKQNRWIKGGAALYFAYKIARVLIPP